MGTLAASARRAGIERGTAVTASNKRAPLTAGAVVLIAASALGYQYSRSAWPFSSAELAQSAHDHAGGQPPAPLSAAADEHAGHVPSADVPAPAGTHAGHTVTTGAQAEQHEKNGPPPGYAELTLEPAQMAGLQLTATTVQDRDLTRTLHTVGTVTLDETRSAHVHPRIRGWIESIRANYVGQKVSAGETLCSIYSQEVYAAELELVSLLGRLGTSSAPDTLLDAARQRLSLWDVPKSELERLEQTREPQRSFPLLAPRAGTVVAKAAIQGMYVEPALELYTLSDLSRVWVQADIYELDIPNVHAGDVAKLTLQGEEEAFEGKVTFLAPTIDEATRTRKVRFELANKNGRFLPGAFAYVEMNVPMGKGLVVPENAVIRTGTRAIVFVVHGEHDEHIIPREVKLGPLVADLYRIETGLKPGERVATGAQFLLDSESRLRASSAPGGAHVH